MLFIYLASGASGQALSSTPTAKYLQFIFRSDGPRAVLSSFLLLANVDSNGKDVI